ncbi:MAG: hypothetical protein KGJ77_00595 [Acidobacteriota bacterium]|nr:hypothetical protein [Acidobacteriota bacterium]
MARRWRGQPGRLEVWYATWSDPRVGAGGWVHHELVAPREGAAYVHGWTALFRPPAPPLLERFGPAPVDADGPGDGPVPATEGASLVPPRLRGALGRLAWELEWTPAEPAGATLWTFPSWAWDREVLPGAQIVPVPSAAFFGAVTVDGERLALSPAARGAVAHIYGHGNAERWGWLHAELGDGDVLEVVAATSRRTVLDRLPPAPFLQLRLGGRDWPRRRLAAVPLLRAELGLPRWRVAGTVGRWRLGVEVELPEHQTVSVSYTDPDGAGATCANSEVADAEIVLEHRRGGRWRTARSWSLEGTAHAEIGTRP